MATNKIKPEDLPGFEIWLTSIGYELKTLPDGNKTYKNRHLRPSYVFIALNNTGNGSSRILYKEYRKHLAS